ncbi:torso-like protein isoform X2 [Lycorma delicatula]|uniref:torso-like protein isoform X2 n=1 Tax=Lycorma delicatula TaxID=130591 RepID=UPI003F50E5FE
MFLKNVIYLILMIILLQCNNSNADIAVGYGIDIFRYWGDLGHFFRNDIRNVMMPVYQHPLAITRQLEGDGRSLIKGGFQIELCRDVSELLEAFFRSFYVERSKRSWRLFSAGWSKNKIGKKLGLNSTYLNGPHGYAFLRMSRFRQAVTLDPAVRSEEIVISYLDNNVKNVVPGNVQNVLEFFTISGSHYISSFVTGDALYQVFVYSSPTFLALQQKIKIYGTDNLSSEDFIKFFSPWYSEHVGNIMVASESPVLESWANNNFLLQMSIFSYPSLIKLHINPEISTEMDHLMERRGIGHSKGRGLCHSEGRGLYHSDGRE